MLFKFFKTTVVISVLVILAALVLSWAGIVINVTPSYPRGFYLGSSVPARIEEGSMVLFCPDLSNQAIKTALHYRLFPPGRCRGGIAPLIKTINGIPGDYVGRERNIIDINYKPISRSFVKYPDLFPQPVTPGYHHLLANNEYWVMSDENPDSFDSRYFGPIKRDQICKILKPLLTE